MFVPLIRVGSIIFIAAAFLGIYGNWVSFGVYSSPQTADPNLNLRLSFGVGILASLAMLAIVRQYLATRHWLGWIGVVSVIGGTIATTVYGGISVFHFSAPVELASGLVRYGSFAGSLGFIFWAMDLPTTNSAALIQKVAMGTMGVLPLAAYLILPVTFPFNVTVTTTHFLIISAIAFLAQLAFGISIWLYREEPRVPLEQAVSEPSFQFTASPLPPSER
jgi:hypothetical protein